MGYSAQRLGGYGRAERHRGESGSSCGGRDPEDQLLVNATLPHARRLRLGLNTSQYGGRAVDSEPGKTAPWVKRGWPPLRVILLRSYYYGCSRKNRTISRLASGPSGAVYEPAALPP